MRCWLYKYSSVLFLSVFSLIICTGCAGYAFPGEQTKAFGETTKTIKITSFVNPTMYTWLPYSFKNVLRDELAMRNVAVWKDSGKTDYTLEVIINSFQIRGGIKDRDNINLLYSASMSATINIYDTTLPEKIHWSTTASYSENFETRSEQQAAELLSEEIVKIIGNRIRLEY